MAVDKSMRILVVDDYESMVRIIRSLLSQLGFTNISSASDGSSALKRLSEETYDLVISDWNMQPMTGLDLLKNVRADGRLRELPFLMVTAEAKVDNVLAAREAGVNNYIIKPFTAQVLKQKLTSMLGAF